MATVVKPFNSINRRFRPGDEVSEADDLSPHSFEDFVSRGFIATGTPPVPAPHSPEIVVE